MNNSLLPPLLGLFGMLAAFVVYRLVMKYPDGEDKVKKIGDQIHTGALAFMKTEYKFLLIFIAVLVVLAQVFLGTETAIAVIVGAACSSLAGFIGMYAATKANVRTATAAQEDGAAAALSPQCSLQNFVLICTMSQAALLADIGAKIDFTVLAKSIPCWKKVKDFIADVATALIF